MLMFTVIIANNRDVIFDASENSKCKESNFKACAKNGRPENAGPNNRAADAAAIERLIWVANKSTEQKT